MKNSNEINMKNIYIYMFSFLYIYMFSFLYLFLHFFIFFISRMFSYHFHILKLLYVSYNIPVSGVTYDVEPSGNKRPLTLLSL